jgi:hypothetical protein
VYELADTLQLAIRRGADRDEIERCYGLLSVELPVLITGLRGAAVASHSTTTRTTTA